ncbi:MAG: glycosyltransferase [Bacteroidota bacterium]|nr:glycosyltransferase [Bacteroidota bacterium]
MPELLTFPKVLIFGQPFNDFSGGGITLTNLFKGWPKDKIAVAFIGHGLLNITTDVCNTVYQLGRDEHKWIFPLNLIQRKFKSGLRSFNDTEVKVPANYIQSRLRYRIVNNYFYPALEWIGLFHMLSRIQLSEGFKSWLSEFKPEILYFQLSSRETILFATDLYDYLRIPVVNHIMDDWPSAISSKGPFRKYWASRIDWELRAVFRRTDLFLSIGEAMSEEYLKRYGIKFIPFHNPIDTERWLAFTKTDFSINPEHVTILYSGRVGEYGITESLYEVAGAIDSMESGQYKIKLHIQTPTKKENVLNKLKEYKCVVINPFAEYERIPEIFASADILLLANDFNPNGIDYLRLSMPTKAPEYMISGSPVLVYASDQTAVSDFFSRNKCGYCVTSQDTAKIQKAIMDLIDNRNLRETLSSSAVSLARHKFDSSKVRKDFQDLIKSIVKS